MTVLRPITEAEYTAWLAAVIPEYAADKVASGQWAQAVSIEKSTQEYTELLPQGQATPDNHLYTILDAESAAVGVLWFAVTTQCEARIAYVFDISVWPERQRQGHALRALRALEDEARTLGLAGIALHVFGHNTAARALYDKLGFQVTNLNLFKPVDPSQAQALAAAP